MKFFKINSIAAFLILFAISIGSCGKQLDLLPIDEVVEESALTNVPNLERGMIGVYAAFNGTYGNDIYASALYSDESWLPSENNTGRGVIAFRWQTDPGTGEVTQAWNAYYLAIDRANRIIAAADRLSGQNPNEETLRLRIKGEALALRAFGHLQLLLNFAEGFEANDKGVPYMKTSAIGKPARITVGEVFTNILADLQEAESLVPASYASKTRISRPGIFAIRAKTALYAKNWPLAISASTDAINAVPVAERNQYASIWTDASANPEVIWKLKRTTAQEGRIGDVFFDRGQNIIVYGPSAELLQTMTIEDVRLPIVGNQLAAGRITLGKYVGGDPNEPNRADLKVFRTSEMYLIRAEARARNNQVALGVQDLNFLRSKRINNYADVNITDPNELVNAVLLERFKELSFEGHRVADLRRSLLPITRIPADAVNAQGNSTLLPTSRTYYFPIPADEILANENIEQNSGYLR
jgi:hypothetical protein